MLGVCVMCSLMPRDCRRRSAASIRDHPGPTLNATLGAGVAEKTPIRLGAMSAAKVEVLDGLQEGDRIVIAGAEALGGAPRVVLSR